MCANRFAAACIVACLCVRLVLDDEPPGKVCTLQCFGII